MSEHPRSNPNNSSPKSTEIILNPILAQALASLEVQLDGELDLRPKIKVKMQEKRKALQRKTYFQLHL